MPWLSASCFASCQGLCNPSAATALSQRLDTDASTTVPPDSTKQSPDGTAASGKSEYHYIQKDLELAVSDIHFNSKEIVAQKQKIEKLINKNNVTQEELMEAKK